MTRTGSMLLTAAIAIGLAQTAIAADMPMRGPDLRAPSAIVASNWAGFYVGGHAGYGWANGSYLLNNGTFGETLTFDTDSFLGGGQVGVQAQWGHWVFGIEGSYSWSDLVSTSNRTITPANLAIVDIKNIGTITGRLGWAMDRWMAYGKGGLAYARAHTFDTNTAAGAMFDSRAWETGYTLGLGIEYLWLPNWTVGLEFDYYNFGFDRALPASAGVTGTIGSSNADIYAVMARMNYMFSWTR
jgi:outer membrane immunogenic protein